MCVPLRPVPKSPLSDSCLSSLASSALDTYSLRTVLCQGKDQIHIDSQYGHAAIRSRVFELVPLEKGMKLMGMTTRFDYKITNGEFEKYKTRLCAMGNQQIAGVHFNESDLYAPVLKAH
jgi:hypothetical protein